MLKNIEKENERLLDSIKNAKFTIKNRNFLLLRKNILGANLFPNFWKNIHRLYEALKIGQQLHMCRRLTLKQLTKYRNS